MSESMVERIARSIYEGRNGSGCIPWSRQNYSHREPYRADALSALKAMEKPTEGMVKAGGEPLFHPGLTTVEHECEMATWAYAAMIKAALASK